MARTQTQRIIRQALADYHDAIIEFISNGDRVAFETAKDNIVSDAAKAVIKEGERHGTASTHR